MNNAFYIDTYCENKPFEGYGEQFKEYLDNALSGSSMEISAVTESINKVDEHLTDVVINVEGNLASVAEQVQTNLANTMVNVQTNLANKIDESKNEIIENDNCNKSEIIQKIDDMSSSIPSGISKDDLDNAVEEIKTSVSEAKQEVIDNSNTNKEETIQSVISVQEDATVKITTTIKTESEKAKERLEQIRQELIDAINNSNSIVSMGFTDLNEEVIESRDKIIDEVRQNGEGIYISGGDVEE